MLAVGGEGKVLRPQRPAGPDLCSLLAEQARPQAQLALTLEGGRLHVDATDEDQVAVQPAQVVVGQVGDQWVVPGVRDALALRGEELDQLGTATGGRRG